MKEVTLVFKSGARASFTAEEFRTFRNDFETIGKVVWNTDEISKQQERHVKAKEFVGNKVQLTIEAMEGTKSDLERHVQTLTKKEVTRVMRHVTSYLKENLGLKSIDDIPNCLVEEHKRLLKELTWKKFDNFKKKGEC
ncbi:hypothetical protein [Bacillus toyonensis]|uniref:hypothetical protein n=1 Tax=Bacillus toyonensis TaxID=155322 RepID=UPI00211D55AD|nr:hypothetical protein [Bacillus toyonensis]